MNVLSLFDGMSCGQQALERAGFKVDNYFASEIDKYAMQVTMANYPETIQLGSVVNIDASKLPQIDLLIGGSPCQSFSFAGKRKGMSTKDNIEILTLAHYLKLKDEGYEFEGQSYLFWEYIRIMQEVKPKYFLLENVMMGEKWERVISKTLGVNPVEINSSLVSAQNRRRLYWTNIGMVSAGLFGDMESIIKQPKDVGILLKDILQDNPNAKYYISDKTIDKINRYNNAEKCLTVTDKSMCLAAGYYKQGRDNQYITEQVDEKYYLTDSQTEKVLAKTGVNPNVDEPKILYVYNNVIKQDGKSITLTDPCHNNLRLIEPIPVDEKYYLSDKMKEHLESRDSFKLKNGNDKSGTITVCGEGKQGNNSTFYCEPIPVDEKYYLSESAINYINRDKRNLAFQMNEEDNKSGCITAVFHKQIPYNQIVVHNTQKRSADRPSIQKNKNAGGSGHLSRTDGKTYCLDGGQSNAIEIKPTSRIRRLTPIECERLQTVPDNYTNYVSDSQRYKMLGNGWTVSVISHIFSYINK